MKIFSFSNERKINSESSYSPKLISLLIDRNLKNILGFEFKFLTFLTSEMTNLTMLFVMLFFLQFRKTF